MLKKIFNPFGNNNPNGQPYIPENYDYKRLETELNDELEQQLFVCAQQPYP